jgi:PDZ domain-containing protein
MSFDNEDFESPRAKLGRRVASWLFTLSLLAGVYLLAFAQTPYVIESPGQVFDVLGSNAGVPVIQISKANTYPTTGRLDLLTVLQLGNPDHTPSWGEVISAWLDPSKAVLPLNEVFPPGQNSKQVLAEASAMMTSSQQEAIAASLTYLGYKVPTQTYIASIVKGGASEGLLHADDIILSVGGQKVSNLDELHTAVGKWVGPKPLDVSVLRKGSAVNVSVVPKVVDKALRIGVMVGTKYKFPIDVKLQLQDVGGPSGGMMFALGIIDELTPGSMTGGYHIAGTGTISRDGKVGAIGGIRQKMFAASGQGATWFLAPASNCNEVVGHVPSGLRVVRVSTLKQAISALKIISTGANAHQLQTCTTSK